VNLKSEKQQRVRRFFSLKKGILGYDFLAKNFFDKLELHTLWRFLVVSFGIAFLMCVVLFWSKSIQGRLNLMVTQLMIQQEFFEFQVRRFKRDVRHMANLFHSQGFVFKNNDAFDLNVPRERLVRLKNLTHHALLKTRGRSITKNQVHLMYLLERESDNYFGRLLRRYRLSGIDFVMHHCLWVYPYTEPDLSGARAFLERRDGLYKLDYSTLKRLHSVFSGFSMQPHTDHGKKECRYIHPLFYQQQLRGFLTIFFNEPFFAHLLKRFNLSVGSLYFFSKEGKALVQKTKKRLQLYPKKLPFHQASPQFLRLMQEKSTDIESLNSSLFGRFFVYSAPLKDMPIVWFFAVRWSDFVWDDLKKMAPILGLFFLGWLLFLSVNLWVWRQGVLTPLMKLFNHLHKERLNLPVTFEGFKGNWFLWAQLVSAAFQEKRERCQLLTQTIQNRDNDLKTLSMHLENRQQTLFSYERLASMGILATGLVPLVAGRLTRMLEKMKQLRLVDESTHVSPSMNEVHATGAHTGHALIKEDEIKEHNLSKKTSASKKNKSDSRGDCLETSGELEGRPSEALEERSPEMPEDRLSEVPEDRLPEGMLTVKHLTQECERMLALIGAVSGPWQKDDGDEKNFSTPARTTLSQYIDLALQSFFLVYKKEWVTFDYTPPLKDYHLVCRPYHFGVLVTTLVFDNLESAMRSQNSPHVSFKVVPQGAKLSLIIENNGPSLSEELKKRLFDAFYVTPNDTLLGQSMGMPLSEVKPWLSLVNVLTHRYHGTLEVNNTSTGMQWVLSLPLDHDAKKNEKA